MTFCGIDFGTSNSTIGSLIASKPRLIPLEQGKLDMPSTIFFDDHEPTPLFGREAIEQYVDGHPGRFMRSMKSVLGSSMNSTAVAGNSLPFERVIAVYIKALKSRAEQFTQTSLSQVVMGRPVHFVDDNPTKDAMAQASLAKAAKLAGFKQVEFQYEPIAAALAYEATLTQEALALIVDIGGGTSDFTLIRLSPQRGTQVDRSEDILATSGVHVGGTDLDKQLSLKRVMPHFGYQSRNINKSSMELPYPPFFNFASWHLINSLYEKSAMIELKSMRLDIEDKNLIDRFIRVVERREAHLVALAVEAAKVGLSERNEVQMDLSFVEPDFELRVNKPDFNQTIEAQTNKIVAAMDECLNRAGCCGSKVGAVFLTGGTTSVELIKQRLTENFSDAKIVDGDKFGSVGMGLTIQAAKTFA